MLCVISRKPSRITDAMHFASQGTAYKEDPQASSTHTASRPQTQTQQQLRLWLPRGHRHADQRGDRALMPVRFATDEVPRSRAMHA